MNYLLGGDCIKQTKSKYVSRKSPPYPAQDCKHKILKGNDGKEWESLATNNGIFRWTRLASPQKISPIKTIPKKLEKSPLKKHIVPMLAKDYRKNGNIEFPVLVQPKIDGMRLLYNSKTGTATSRAGNTGKTAGLITLLHALSKANFNNEILDGELYKHGKSFQEVMRMVNSADEKLEYHVFDIISNENFIDRHDYLKKLLAKAPESTRKLVKLVPIATAHNDTEIKQHLKNYIEHGYEGVMIRDPYAPYVQGRTNALFKYKTFEDAEFKVIGWSLDRANKVKWECKTHEGKTFHVSPNADLMAHTTLHYDAYIGKMLTVQYQNLSEDGIPRFPVGKAFRLKMDLEKKRKSPSKISSKSYI